MLYGADKSYGESIARSLLTAVRELRIPHANSETQPYVTVSVGVVSVDAYRLATHDAAVGLADQALYAAKTPGPRSLRGRWSSAQRVDPARPPCCRCASTGSSRGSPVLARVRRWAPDRRSSRRSPPRAGPPTSRTPRNIPSLLKSSTISPRGSIAITPPLPPSASSCREHVRHRFRQRDLQVLAPARRCRARPPCG